MVISRVTDIFIREILTAANRSECLSDVDRRMLAERSLETAQKICDAVGSEKSAEVIAAASILREAAEDLGILKCGRQDVVASLLNTASAARSFRMTHGVR